ncbi:MAG: tetratricopeptide repeat protein [Polyangiaceae bacterium]
MALAIAAPAGMAPSTARAQPEKSPAAGEPASAPRPERYKQHMDNGVRLYADHNYRAAVAEFEAAYAAQPKANPLVNLALCYKAEFRYPKAIEVLEKALTRHLDTMDEADRKAAIDGINEMKALLAHLRVTLVPADAGLRVDGEPVAPDAATRPIAVGPGMHRLVATRQGYLDASQELSVVSGDDKAVTLKLPGALAGRATSEGGKPEAPPASSERYSTSLMVVGIVSGSVGLLTAIGGASILVLKDAVCTEEDQAQGAALCDDEKRIGTGVVLTVIGGALVAAGIPMFIVGAGPGHAAPAASPRASLRPELRVGPASGALRWRF